jgi:CHAT domain-containing protein
VVAPLQGHLPAGADLAISAEGTLVAIPFGALIAPGRPPHYWIEDVTVTMAPSLAALPPATASDPTAPAPAVLVLADPLDGGPEFPRLPYVAGEVAALVNHFGAGAVTLRLGRESRPAAYLEAAPSRYSIIHFGTHALPNRESPLDSAIVLTGGRLSVRDIMPIPLGAELVTLSACRGAETRSYSAEGLVGLAWGFLYAGAKHVVAGMWNVPDRATADLMDRFYGSLSRARDPPHALRSAQLALARSRGPWRLPYYWAAFNVYGGPGAQPR